MLVYVGAFTDGAGERGISVYDLEVETGALTLVQAVPGLFSPTWLARHPHRPLLYAVERRWTLRSAEDGDQGAVAAFSIAADSGRLTMLNRQPSGGVSPCYVSVHPSGRFALAAHYNSGQVSVLPIDSDGRLGPATDVVQHEGRGSRPGRQDGPHAHFITTDPSGRYVLACDLGLDRVLVYRLDEGAGKLIPNASPFAQVSSGAGPRHLAFHPSGRFVYVINELDSTLSAFQFDAGRGAFQIVQTVSTLPADFGGASACAQVLVHPSGRFVYGSNRGHDSIAAFAIDQQTGRLATVGWEPTRGRTPRNFGLHPDGRLLLAANQDSGTIVAFRIDRESGRLSPTGAVTESPGAVCVLFGADARA